MATFVLVHGAGHGGWCYQRVAPILRDAGHDVYTPTLTGLGERSHLLDERVDLALHIDDVVNVVRYEDLRDVILVGHSYGGPVITGTADQVPDRIAKLVYLDAAYVRDGESVADAFGPGGWRHCAWRGAPSTASSSSCCRPTTAAPSSASKTRATRSGCADG